MGLAKMDEDIREAIDNRMRDNSRPYYGNTYINRYPDYPSRKTESSFYYTPKSRYSSTTSTYIPTPYRTKPVIVSALPARKVTPKPVPVKKKIGYIQRNYDHYGIEIYFYSRPSESVLDELKDNGWHWHRQKKCWFRKYTISNEIFAEKIIEK